MRQPTKGGVSKVGVRWTEKEKSALYATGGNREDLYNFQVEYRPEVEMDSLKRMYRKLRQEKEGGFIEEKELMKLLKKKRMSIDELANHFSVSPKEMGKEINKIRDKGILVDSFGTDFQLAKSIAPVEEPLVIDFKKHKEKEYCFGAIADTHLGSKYERLDALNCLYDRFESYGVDTVFLGGNMLEGEARFNIYDIYVRGVEDQVSNFVEKFPQRKGITTKFVTGDDHEGWYVQREHIDIGRVIIDRAKDAGRSDLEYLGHMERDIEFKQEGGSSILRVIHAGGGSSYAISYTSQKYVETLQGGEKPSIVIAGHFHQFDHSYPREVHVIQPGCTQDQTPFMRKRRIQAMVGGVVMWVKQNDIGIFTSVKVEFLPFFDRKYYRYVW
jgi:predicted phosphodiesterase/biotin operon repressor